MVSPTLKVLFLQAKIIFYIEPILFLILLGFLNYVKLRRVDEFNLKLV